MQVYVFVSEYAGHNSVLLKYEPSSNSCTIIGHDGRVLLLSSGPVKPEVIAASPFENAHTDDAWLQRWLPLLQEHAGDRCVLELGCGNGRDTAVLNAAGLRVVAIDHSRDALAEAREAVPGATFIESDLRAPLPIDAGQVGAIVASLSLHYFDWQTTRQLVEQLRLCLTPNRPLLCRVNATGDVHHGSTGHPSIEPGYFRVGHTTKRFFTRADLLKLFTDRWHIVALEEQTIDRYKHPKVIWELLAFAAGRSI